MTPLIYRTSGEIDSPEKKARVDAARARFDDADADLKVRRFGAPVAAPPRADVPTTMPLVYVRVKEGPRVLVTRVGLSAASTTTYFDLTRDAVLQSLSEEDWQRLKLLPMTVETFSDYNETEQSKIVMAIGACTSGRALGAGK